MRSEVAAPTLSGTRAAISELPPLERCVSFVWRTLRMPRRGAAPNTEAAPTEEVPRTHPEHHQHRAERS